MESEREPGPLCDSQGPAPTSQRRQALSPPQKRLLTPPLTGGASEMSPWLTSNEWCSPFSSSSPPLYTSIVVTRGLQQNHGQPGAFGRGISVEQKAVCMVRN